MFRCLGPAIYDAGDLTEDGTPKEGARVRDWKRTCGFDLAPVIEAEVPQDGETHDYVCPECGAPHHATRT